jgi:hypothetical protein
MGESYRLLLFGTSNVVFTETGPEDTLPGLTERELKRLAPQHDWTCIPAHLPPSRDMAERAMEHVDTHRPDAAYLCLSASYFVYEQVSDRIRRRWPRVYKVIGGASDGVKEAAGGEFDGSAGVRGLLFRGPRWLAERAIGVEPLVRPEHATANMKRTVAMLAEKTGVPVIFRWSFLSPRPASRNPIKYRRVLDEFNAAIVEECERHGFGHYDLIERMTAAGRAPTQVADGVHQDIASRAFEASVVADLFLELLQAKSKPAGSTAQH